MRKALCFLCDQGNHYLSMVCRYLGGSYHDGPVLSCPFWRYIHHSADDCRDCILRDRLGKFHWIIDRRKTTKGKGTQAGF